MMTKMLIVLVAVGALLTACGDDDATEDALTSVCDAEKQIVEDIGALVTLDPAETSGDDFKGMVEDLQSSVDDLEGARDDLQSQDVDNVSSAFDSLKSSLSDLGDEPLTELDDAATATIGAAIEDFRAAYAEAYANSSCTPEADEGEEEGE